MSFRKSLSVKFAVCLVLGALALAVPGATRTASAQETQPQAQAAPKTSASIFKAERQAVKEEEAEETDQFRHSATVQWLARTLHMDVEAAATTFEYINFIVILLIVGVPLYRTLPKMLRERRARLSFELDQAKARTADASARLKAVEEKLAGLDAEITQIRRQVEQEMAADEARSKAQLEEETARVVRGAEHEIAAAAAQAQRGLKEFAANLAVDRALSQLKIDEAADRALFAEFASDAAGSGTHGKGDRA